ncbi:MAG: DUF1501 domain-containing protein [Myxococcaceae bacterium]
MKLHELERLSPFQRRQFLKGLGVLLGAATVDPLFRHDVNELVGGAAYAQSAALPTYFIEVNLRDQWDQGHVFVAPGLATATGLQRGATGRLAALYFTPEELKKYVVNGTDVYLTADSADLQPHLDSIAMIDTCELSQGEIHGHEAANALRSPGRSYAQTAGKTPMYQLDPVSNFPQGCEAFFSSTPTPASLHNYQAKLLDRSLRNGIALKFISRSLHTVYHFAAGLPGAELDRKQTVASLLSAYPDSVVDANILATKESADLFTRILQRMDKKYLELRSLSTTGQASHQTTLEEGNKTLYVGTPKLISLPLTTEERAFWSAGVPNQVDAGNPKANIWEQMAYAFKLVSNDMTRSVALEFDYVDVHDTRPEAQVRTEAKQVSLPLARLIQKLKEAGIYDRTLIAIYTVDGSRAPAGESTGGEGKNTVILAGGMIKGGYYGDVRVASNLAAGHVYSYHAPDPVTGALMPGRIDNIGRLAGAPVWRTVMKALKVGDALCDQFPDVRGISPIPYLLKA